MIKTSPQKIYYFVFFSASYAFLSFWISLSYFGRASYPEIANGFLIGGILVYLFVLIFHKAIINITNKNLEQADKIIKDKRLIIFYTCLIIFCGLGLVSIYLLQKFLIRSANFPSEIFARVNFALNLLSFITSFLLSFFEKK